MGKTSSFLSADNLLGNLLNNHLLFEQYDDKEVTGTKDSHVYPVYYKGTNIQQEPEFDSSKAQTITEKSMEVYYLDKLYVIKPYVAGILHPTLSQFC